MKLQMTMKLWMPPHGASLELWDFSGEDDDLSGFSEQNAVFAAAVVVAAAVEADIASAFVLTMTRMIENGGLNSSFCFVQTASASTSTGATKVTASTQQ